MSRSRPQSKRAPTPEPNDDELPSFGAEAEATIAVVDEPDFGWTADATIAQVDEPFSEATPVLPESQVKLKPLDKLKPLSLRALEAPAPLGRSPFVENTPVQGGAPPQPDDLTTGDLKAEPKDSPFDEATPFEDGGEAAGFGDDEMTAMEAEEAPQRAVAHKQVAPKAPPAAPRRDAAPKKEATPAKAAPRPVLTEPPDRPTEPPQPTAKPVAKVATQQHTESEFAARFTMGPPVGSGGMAEVRLGYEKIVGEVRPCVIKRIAREYAKQAKYREMFIEEVRLSRLLDHPNVVRAYSDGEVDGAPYIVFELIDGVTLKDFQRLAGEPIPPAVAAEIAIEVTNGLAYAHGAVGEDGEPLKLVHRDVSPQNILISRRSEVKLVDFGIARFEGRMHSTMSGEVKGKMKYMALEQLAEKPVDGRADIFALGIVIAEVLGILKEGFTEHFVSGLEDSPRHVPRPLYDLLKKMTAPKQEGRPANGDELLKELVRVHAQLPKVTLDEFGRRTVFTKHKSILDKSAASAPKAAPKAVAPKPAPKPANPETDFDGGADFDADSEATQGYAEFLAAGHMPIMPSQSGMMVAPASAEPEAEEPTPPPAPAPHPKIDKRALAEPTSRVRLRGESKAQAPEVVALDEQPAAPRSTSRSPAPRPIVEKQTAPARGTSGGSQNPLPRATSLNSPPAPRAASGGLPNLRNTGPGAPNPLVRATSGPQVPGSMSSMSMPGMQLPPGVAGGLTPEMLAEMSRRSGMAPQPAPSAPNKLVWIIAVLLTALALVVLGVAVALKLRPVPAETTTTTE